MLLSFWRWYTVQWVCFLRTAQLHRLGLNTDIIVSESVHWPAGSYGIPKAASGCPYDDDFQWLIGRRYQDTEDGNSNNYKSAEFHLDAIVNKNDIERSFCVKTDTSTDIKRNRWPPGNAMTFIYVETSVRLQICKT